jgi:hypothetical protein
MFCFQFNNLILTTKFKKFKINNLIQNKLNTCFSCGWTSIELASTFTLVIHFVKNKTYK